MQTSKVGGLKWLLGGLMFAIVDIALVIGGLLVSKLNQRKNEVIFD